MAPSWEGREPESALWEATLQQQKDDGTDVKWNVETQHAGNAD